MGKTITVIIPTYNKADYISQTIESVLQQTYQNFEIVIVDDCSQDDTEATIQKYLSDKIRYSKHSQNWGPGATFNDGIEKAQTEYVTLIASDDILLPDHLEVMISEFKRNDCVSVVFPTLKVIDEHNRDLKQIISPPYQDKYKLLNHLFYKGNDIPSPGVSFKKSIFKKIPAFNPNLILMHDYDLNVRLLMHTETVNASKPTVLYRRFSDKKNLSSDNNWFRVCHRAESKTVLDNYLTMSFCDMVTVFPYLKNCKQEYRIFKLLIETCKLSDMRLADWAFEKLVHYLNDHPDFFTDNDFNFQYKDYIQLYKLNARNVIGTTHKEKLYNDVKIVIKKLFGLH